MTNDDILKINTVLKQRDKIKAKISKELRDEINIYIVYIILLLEEDFIFLDYDLFL